MEKKFEFKKLSNNKYAFVMTTDDIERTEIVSKDFAMNHYNELLKQRQELMTNKVKIEKEIDNNKYDGDIEEIEHFMKLADAAGKYNKYKQAVSNKEATEDMVKAINESISAIEHTIPELKRVKKS